MNQATATDAPPESQASLAATVARLERRLVREKAARVEAEKIAEEGLRSLYSANQDLDKKVQERTAQLDTALAAAETASNAKSAFLEHISHEVRTPLNGIVGMTELVASSALSEQQQVWVGSLSESTTRLQRLFDRLLVLVALEGLDLRSKAQAHNVEDFLDSVASRWRPRSAVAGQLLVVESQVETTTHLLGTLDEINMLMDELLDNAANYANPGAVTLKAWHDPGEIPMVVLQVSDSGPGLADDFLDVMAPSDATTREGGQGLGLAIADRVMNSLGGSVNLDSDTSGTQVTLRLPAAQ